MRVEHLTSQLGGFICHLAAQFAQHSVGPKAVKLRESAPLKYCSSQRGFFLLQGPGPVAVRDREWKWTRLGSESGRSPVGPGWGKQEGQEALSALLSITCALSLVMVQVWWLCIIPCTLLPLHREALHCMCLEHKCCLKGPCWKVEF